MTSYEQRDASVRVIGISAVLIALLVSASIGASAWIYHGQFGASSAAREVRRTTSFRSGAEEEPDIAKDYRATMQSAEEHLHGFAWVDRKAGVVQIPIDRALELLAHGAKPVPAPKEPGQVP